MTNSAYIANARKVDTEVARLYSEFHKVNDQIAPIRKQMAVMMKYTFLTAEQKEDRRIKAQGKIADLADQAEPLLEAANTYNQENYTGWNRFFLVKHIHNSTHCSSFRLTTRIGWLPDVSGLTEAEAVAAHGETLCTICFPSAPTELTTKAVDDSICTGTRDYKGPSRTGYYTGNWGTCTEGHERVTLTSAGNLRRHKK